jgi:hypothetical protein
MRPRLLVIPAALALGAVPAIAAPPEAAPPTASYALEAGLPALDGGRGLGLTFEAQDRQVSPLALTVTAEAARSAEGDYRGTRVGGGLGVRWYWRGRAIWSAAAPGAPIGWFVGGRLDVAGAWTTNLIAHRALGTALGVELQPIVGYRLAPWRGLTITPWTGLAVRTEWDLGGRLPAWTRGGLTVGLDVGWRF